MLKVFKLKGTPAEMFYRGCGESRLVVKNGTPEIIIYEGSDFYLEDYKIEGVEVFRGMTSCYEFVAECKLELW